MSSAQEDLAGEAAGRPRLDAQRERLEAAVRRLRAFGGRVALRGVPDVPLEPMLRLAHAALIARGAESWTSAVGGQRVHRYAFNGRGRGPAVLLLHGLGGSASSMAGLVSALSPLAPRIVLLELPGHGRSPDPAGGPLSAREHGAVAIVWPEDKLGL